jgi:hypothetical protein
VTATSPSAAAAEALTAGRIFGQVVLAPLGTGATDAARLTAVKAAAAGKWPVWQMPGVWYDGAVAYTITERTLVQDGTIAVPTDTCSFATQPRDPQYAPFSAWLTSNPWIGVMDSMWHVGYNAHYEIPAEPQLRWGFENNYQLEAGRFLAETYCEWNCPQAAMIANGYRVRSWYPFFDKFTGWSRTWMQTGYANSEWKVLGPGNNEYISIIASGVKVIGGAGAPATISAGDTLQIKVDGGAMVETTFAAGDTSFPKIVLAINAAFATAPLATVESGVLTLISHAAPPAGSIEIVGGTAVAKCGLVVGTTTVTIGSGTMIYTPATAGNWGSPALTPPVQSAAALDTLAAKLVAIEAQLAVLQADQLSTASVARLRADMGVTLAGGVVSQWDDTRLGSAVSATQGTAGKRPTQVLTGGPNNRAYLHFTAASSTSLATGAIVIAQPSYVLVVGRFANLAAASGTMVDGLTGNRMRLYCGVGEVAIYDGATLSYGAGAMTSWRAYGAYFNGANSTISINSAVKITGDAGVGAQNGLTIGDFGGGGDPLAGDVCEVIVIPSPTAQILDRMYRYVLAYYGLTP